ncbi:MAG TPA: 5-dehydro-4-deoxy-D-glucuronate isomerase [Tepidisphaeraceae bacterium]|nr:5-dehydro-4-deoxy-D-glucuronate isomerase [Tepidisphaeraceae bacterium]
MPENPFHPFGSPRSDDVQSMSTGDLRLAFLVENLFAGGGVNWRFTDLDRLTVGGVMPTKPVALNADRHTGTEFFLQRRELGMINIGGPGEVLADGKSFGLENLDCLYLGMGTRKVEFKSASAKSPAKFYLMSCPAHQSYPATHIAKKQIKPIEIGSAATANRRRIYQYIHAKGIKSCQLVMGFTELDEGSVWNTMPPHTHLRRSEIYFYFDLGENVVSHFLGPPQGSRHVWVRNEQAVLSPPWSIHCGCGTAAYKFIWAMAGENQNYDDMDPAPISELR